MGKSAARVWEEMVTLPTYKTGKPELHPVFCEQRMFQGGCGKVYPYPVIETVSDKVTDQVYRAVYMENEYLKICILPELGGRIWSAVDKTCDLDFVYHNHVVKPAFAGLTGPWIVGGIEFCQQHHGAFEAADYRLEKGEDGSCSVYLQMTDRIHGVKNITKLTLYPERAYIEITGQLYNGTAFGQPSLWGVNLAVAAGENRRTIFPPDTDAARSKKKFRSNRCRTEQSDYDFLGSYDYEREVGVLCLANHYIAPGKRQWTRGGGAVRQVWERNLTDADGDFVELMSGVFSGDRPDAIWLAAHEEKRFVYHVMPYRGVGVVKNATRNAAVGLELSDSDLTVRVYSTRDRRVRIVLMEGFQTLLEEDARISPAKVYERTLECNVVNETMLQLSVYDLQTNALLITYRPEPETDVRRKKIFPASQPLPGEPREYPSNEALYLAGVRIDRHRPAVRQPDEYYIEALQRDPDDIRINTAYGQLLMRRGNFEAARGYLETAYKSVCACDLNCYFGEAAYNLALCEFYQENYERAYEYFYRASWSNLQEEMSCYYLAVLDARAGKMRSALEQVGKTLAKNAHNIQARGLQAYLLRKLGQTGTALHCCRKNLEHDPFDYVSANEIVMLGKGKAKDLDARMGGTPENYLAAARTYGQFGGYGEAVELLERCPEQTPPVLYYKAYYQAKQRRTPEAARILHRAEEYEPGRCLPNDLEDIGVLRYAIGETDGAMARYYLGCLLYDRGQRQEAARLWEQAAVRQPKLAILHRNLALAYYNVTHDADMARREMEKAFYLDETDAGVFRELDWLDKSMGMSFDKRLERYEKYADLIESRDDLYIEYITLLNMTGQYEKAHDLTMQRHFRIWDGCEGKIGAQYVRSLLEMANHLLVQGDAVQAERYLQHALVYPENLGEAEPEGVIPNHIFYHLGLALELQEKYDEADHYYKKAAQAGSGKPSDRLLYQGLSHLKLGDEQVGYQCFDSLIAYGREHLEDAGTALYERYEYCGIQSFEEDFAAKNRAHCYYLMGLGHLGYGDREQANQCFAKAVETEPSNTDCRMYADI